MTMETKKLLVAAPIAIITVILGMLIFLYFEGEKATTRAKLCYFDDMEEFRKFVSNVTHAIGGTDRFGEDLNTTPFAHLHCDLQGRYEDRKFPYSPICFHRCDVYLRSQFRYHLLNPNQYGEILISVEAGREVE